VKHKSSFRIIFTKGSPLFVRKS